MIKDDFEELLGSISTGFNDNKKSNADDIIVKTYHFFSRLKEELKTATGSEKDELLQMIKTMHERVNEYSQKSCERVGMSESELIRLSDDEEIFTPDQRKVLEMARKEMQESSKVIRTHMEGKVVEHKAVDLEAPPSSESRKPKKKKGAGTGKKKSKRRDGWLKS